MPLTNIITSKHLAIHVYRQSEIVPQKEGNLWYIFPVSKGENYIVGTTSSPVKIFAIYDVLASGQIIQFHCCSALQRPSILQASLCFLFCRN